MTDRSRTIRHPNALAVDPSDRNNPHTLAVLSIPPGSRVLDIGCADGSVARALVARGSQVWGVEIDRAAAAAATEVCEQVVIGDVDVLDLQVELEACDFDFVLFLGVLEHLRDPSGALERSLRLLAPQGRVLASILNVAHASVRLQLLTGRFPGAAQLRFFDQVEMRRLFTDVGCELIEELPIRRTLHSTELAEFDVASELLHAVGKDPDSDIQTFFVSAAPARPSMDAPAGSLHTELWRRIRELEQLVAEGEAQAQRAARFQTLLSEESARVTALGAEIERRDERIADLDRAIVVRMEELRERGRAVEHLRIELGVKERHAAALRSELEQVRVHRDGLVEEVAWRITLHEGCEDAGPLHAEIAALRLQLATVADERDRLAARASYLRYRIADRLSRAAKRMPGVHRLLRLLARGRVS